MKKKEFEAFDERVRALQGSVGDAESRMEALAAKDKHSWRSARRSTA